jgi:hypothetical protein
MKFPDFPKSLVDWEYILQAKAWDVNRKFLEIPQNFSECYSLHILKTYPRTVRGSSVRQHGGVLDGVALQVARHLRS